jgi:(4S)-4-hydroxy-5-phosphonooxypentane-2,3-dione isomerase
MCKFAAMITRIVKMTFHSEQIPVFLALFKKNKNLIRGSEGCTHLELLNDKNNPNIFFTYSKWQDENFLEKYRQSDLFNSVWKQTKIMFSENAEAWTVSSVSSEKQAESG